MVTAHHLPFLHHSSHLKDNITNKMFNTLICPEKHFEYFTIYYLLANSQQTPYQTLLRVDRHTLQEKWRNDINIVYHRDSIPAMLWPNPPE